MIYQCSEKRIEDLIHTFRDFGATDGGGITRYSLSKPDLQARQEFIKRLEVIGAKIKIDDMGNIYAILEGDDPSLPTILTGSHTDSVKDGGNYDGILGVLAGIEVLQTLVEEKIPHHHNIGVVVWTNEEGSLYPPATMASGVIAYDALPKNIRENYRKEDVLASKSVLGTGESFGQVLEESGYKGDPKNRLNKKDYKAFFELHIEQGPILQENQKDIGVVTCVQGMCNYRIRTLGVADHSGTTPMKNRKDALYAMVKVIQYLHDQLDKLDPQLVYTTGEIHCHPNVHTVIPGRVEISLDARHEDPSVIREVEQIIEGIPKEIVGCKIESHLAWKRDTVYFAPRLVDYVQESVDDLGYSNQKIVSGAGHDAQFISYLIPSTMIFVPSKDGHSHCEVEYTSVKECTQGASVLLNAILKVDAEKEERIAPGGQE